jgi:hypothetical protein
MALPNTAKTHKIAALSLPAFCSRAQCSVNEFWASGRA